MFTRGGDAKETIGIGSFATMVKELKVLLVEQIIERKNVWTFYSQRDPVEANILEWKSFPGGSNNICKLVALVKATDPREFAEFIKADKYSLKHIFKSKDCKFTAINFYLSSPAFRKYEFGREENTIIIEIIYSKIKKK